MSIITNSGNNGQPLQIRAREAADSLLREVNRHAPEDQTSALQALLGDFLATTRDVFLCEMVLSELARRLRLHPKTLRELVATAPESSPVTCHPFKAVTMTAENPRVSRFADLASIEPKDVEWLVDRLLARGKITLLDAPPGAAKTSFAVALTHALSTGSRFIGLDTVPCKTLWLQFEMSDGDLALKYEQLGGLPQGAVFIAPEPEPLRESYAQLVNGVLAENIGVVVVDLLYDWLALEDYNDIAQARAGMQLLRRFVNDTSCAVLGIRHVFKGASLSTPHAGAGSHIFAGKADFCFTLEADIEQSDIATLRAVKARYGSLRAWTITLRLQDGRFLPVEQPREVPLHQQVADYVRRTGRRVAKAEILERFNTCSEPSLRRALEKAVRFGVLQVKYERTGRSTRALFWASECDESSPVTVTPLNRRQVTGECDVMPATDSDGGSADPFADAGGDSLWQCDPISGEWYPRHAGGGER